MSHTLPPEPREHRTREQDNDQQHHEPRAHRHHRHHHRRTKKSAHTYSFLLFLWSLVSLVSILILFNDIQSAPAWKVASLVSSSVCGLFFCMLLLARSKK
jgi:hypothetical protein